MIPPYMDITSPPLSIADLFALVEKQSQDLETLYNHYTSGSLDQFYKQTIDQTVEMLMLMPARRHLQQLPMVDDDETVAAEVTKIAALIAVMCGKLPTTVQHDIMLLVSEFPSDDVREATILRQNNRLN